MSISAAHAQRGPFEPPDGPPARQATYPRSALVDCGAHGSFHPPADWTARTVGSDIHLTSPDGRIRLIRPRAPVRSADAFRERVARITGALLDGPPALEAVSEVRHGRWNVERTVRGTGTRSGQAIAIDARSGRAGAIWIALYASEAPSDRASVQAVIDSWAMLTSHACQCGYDCDRRPAVIPR